MDKVSPMKLFDDNKSLAGFNLRHLLYQQNKVEYVTEVLGKVFDLWKQQKITPVVDSKWALEDVSITIGYVQAFRFLFVQPFQMMNFSAQGFGSDAEDARQKERW